MAAGRSEPRDRSTPCERPGSPHWPGRRPLIPTARFPHRHRARLRAGPGGTSSSSLPDRSCRICPGRPSALPECRRSGARRRRRDCATPTSGQSTRRLGAARGHDLDGFDDGCRRTCRFSDPPERPCLRSGRPAPARLLPPSCSRSPNQFESRSIRPSTYIDADPPAAFVRTNAVPPISRLRLRHRNRSRVIRAPPDSGGAAWSVRRIALLPVVRGRLLLREYGHQRWRQQAAMSVIFA